MIPLRREGRSVSAEPVCSCAFLLVQFAHGTAGAARTRSSLRPRISWGRAIGKAPGASRGGRRSHVGWVVIAPTGRALFLTLPLPREGKSRTRSPMLTNFWHCGGPSFSFRTGAERRPGNEPSTVLAEDCASKGSGNADSQLFVRSSGGSGARRPSPGDSGCVTAHPASWRASASYRPLRAVWAVGAWALRGSREITRSLPR